MAKNKLNKDIRQSIFKSMGRFLSIFSLMALGIFVFVGLKVSGPNMRATAEKFYSTHNLADLTVTSTFGLDESDQEIIRSAQGIKQVEFGYFQDVLIKDSMTSVRLFSAPMDVSTYQLMSGRMPENNDEIALDFLREGEFHLGDTIDFTEKKTGDDYVLKNHQFKIVGFVKSSEYVDKNAFGRTTIGTGELSSYAVVVPEVFQSDVYMIARITYTDLAAMSPFEDNFNTITEKHQTAMEELLADQPEKRLAQIRREPQEKIVDARQQIADELSNLDQAQEQIDAQKAQLEQFGLPIPAELTQHQEQIDEGRKTLEEHKAELDENQADLDNLALPQYTVNDRKSANPGYQSFIEDSQRIDALSNVFPVFLFLIAAMVSLTTMTRFVEEERKNIGLLKALGYTNAQIQKKFIVYGMISACAGALVGSILGHTFLPIIVFQAYTASSTFDDLVLTFSPFWTAVAFGIAMLCTVFPAVLVSNSELKETPASLFLAKVPKSGSRIFLERIKPIWNRMSFTYKVTARNLFRYKKRMLMTIFGIAGCTGLLIMGFGIRDSLADISSRQFGEILHYDLVAIQKENPSASELEDLNQLLAHAPFTAHEPIHFEQVSVRAGHSNATQYISLFVPQNVDEFHHFVTLRNRISGENLPLEDNGAVVSEKLAKLLNARVGDTITVEDSDNKEIHIKISGIMEMYMGHYIFMNEAAYQNFFGTYAKPNANMIELDDHSIEATRKASVSLMSQDAVVALQQNLDIRESVDAFLEGMNSVMYVLIICAVLLAIVVIYNLTNINVSERIRELSTIKVLGFYDKEVTMYIYRETILLSFIGIFIGYGLGGFLHGFILTQLAPDNGMFSPDLLCSNYLISAVITMVTTLLLSIVVHYRIKRVNMLEALKSVD